MSYLLITAAGAERIAEDFLTTAATPVLQRRLTATV